MYSMGKTKAIASATILLSLVLFQTDGCAENDEITDHYRRMMVYHEYMDGNVPDGAVVFIGDSITQGLCVCAVTPLAVNYGIGSDTTYGVLQRLPKYKSLEHCAAIVFAIGVNDLSRRSDDEIISNWKLIMQSIPEDIPAIFSAMHPLDAETKNISEESNQRIVRLNEALKNLCAENNQYFASAYAKLVNEKGNLDPAFHTGDGVHLNTAGYQVWIAVLQTALQSIPQE